MAVLAAQARFIQHHRRMALPLAELPGDLFHAALLALRSIAEESEAASAERTLRDRYDEGHGRLGLISHLVMRMGKAARAHVLATGLWSVRIERMSELYAELAAGRTPAPELVSD